MEDFEKLFLEMQASVQGIKPDFSRFVGYSDTMQLMVSAGIHAVNGYHRGLPQIIQLDDKCMGNPKIKHFNVPTKQKVTSMARRTCSSTACTSAS